MNEQMPPAVTGPVEPTVGPLAQMTASETAWMMRNPYALSLLMDYEDQRYSEHSSVCEPGECGRWPTARYTAFYERGRSIMAEDLGCWPAELLRAFGFPERPNAATNRTP